MYDDDCDGDDDDDDDDDDNNNDDDDDCDDDGDDDDDCGCDDDEDDNDNDNNDDDDDDDCYSIIFPSYLIIKVSIEDIAILPYSTSQVQTEYIHYLSIYLFTTFLSIHPSIY